MTNPSAQIRSETHADIDEIVRLESQLFEENSGAHEPFADVTLTSASKRHEAALT